MLISDRLSDGIIAVSDAVSQQAINEGTPSNVIETIYNSVYVPDGNVSDEGSFSGQPVIGTVGHLHPDKGYATLIESTPAILAQLPKARVVIVGEGRERTRLQRLVGELGVSDHIFFLGERLDVPNLLRQFDIFVFPSLREGMPNALLEAMAIGLPVVASAVGGILEVVSDGVNGLLVPPASPMSLADATVRLWCDVGLRKDLGAAARQHIAEKFGDVEQEVTTTENVYLKLLGHPVGCARPRIRAHAPDTGVLHADRLSPRPLAERI
jgi:glycosyltransferase involved in cell wall biosynthesis